MGLGEQRVLRVSGLVEVDCLEFLPEHLELVTQIKQELYWLLAVAEVVIGIITLKVGQVVELPDKVGGQEVGRNLELVLVMEETMVHICMVVQQAAEMEVVAPAEAVVIMVVGLVMETLVVLVEEVLAT
jgi:hypothetical protein